MLKMLLHTVTGVLALLVIGLSTLLLSTLIVALAMVMLLVPEGRGRHVVRRLITGLAETWIAVNNLILSLYPGTNWDIRIDTGLDRRGCYLVLANHQSWVDILVLQKCFNRKLPLLRFFLKKQLIWVPFLGVAWWALDFPFMHRASRADLRKRPELRGADLESARRACEIFANVPVAMMSFPEGTRFTEAKRVTTDSPYRHLLKPKAGGAGAVLYALGKRLDGCIDVTIVYPGRAPGQSAPSFWQLVSGQVSRVVVRATRREIPPALLGANDPQDPQTRQLLQDWMTRAWQDKDQQIETIISRQATLATSAP